MGSQARPTATDSRSVLAGVPRFESWPTHRPEGGTAGIARNLKMRVHVRVVSAWNATTNAAMLAINEKPGFRELRVAEMPPMTVDALEAYLARARAPVAASSAR